MKQDVKTALKEMLNQILYMRKGVVKIFLNITTALVALFLLGAFVWLIVYYFWLSMGITAVAFISVWFWCEYSTAKNKREYYEMCQVNKGKT